MGMVGITWQKGLLTFSLHWPWALLWILHVILCSCPSSSALRFPDDFIEKQWQIMTFLFC